MREVELAYTQWVWVVYHEIGTCCKFCRRVVLKKWTFVHDAKTLFPHPPSPFPGNFCNCNSAVICTASQFYVQLPLLYTAWSNACSEIGPEVTLRSLATSCAKDYKGHSLVQTSFTEPPNSAILLGRTIVWCNYLGYRQTLLGIVIILHCFYIALLSALELALLMSYVILNEWLYGTCGISRRWETSTCHRPWKTIYNSTSTFATLLMHTVETNSRQSYSQSLILD